MITVEKAKKFRCCNICCNQKNVYNVVMRYEGTNQGAQITLCDECIKDLIQKLNCSVFPNSSEVGQIIELSPGDRIKIEQVGMYPNGCTRQWMGNYMATVIRVNKKTATVRIDAYPNELHRVDLQNCIKEK